MAWVHVPGYIAVGAAASGSRGTRASCDTHKYQAHAGHQHPGHAFIPAGGSNVTEVARQSFATARSQAVTGVPLWQVLTESSLLH